MPFEKEAFLFTILVIAANSGMLVLSNVEGFGINHGQYSSQGTAYFARLAPEGLRFWESDTNSIDNTKVNPSGLASGENSFATTNPDILSIFITTIASIPTLLITVFQMLVFLVIGHVLIMQMLLLPSWMIFLAAMFTLVIQVWGFLYIASYVLNAFRGKIG